MALGQVQPLATGQRSGGGTARATPYRTTPLTPSPVTPLNSGNTRAPAGMNASLGQVRADRGQIGQVQGGPNTAPNVQPLQPRTRVLRPLIADRLNPIANPQQVSRASGSLAASPVGQMMPGTQRAYLAPQPQTRGPYSPTPATAGPRYWNPAMPLPGGPGPIS